MLIIKTKLASVVNNAYICNIKRNIVLPIKNDCKMKQNRNNNGWQTIDPQNTTSVMDAWFKMCAELSTTMYNNTTK